MYKRLITGGLVFGMAAIAPPAEAQPLCTDRTALVARLTGAYDEVQLATGLQGNGVVVEIWAAPGSGSWTIFLTGPEGLSCIASSGTGLSLGLMPQPIEDVAG